MTNAWTSEELRAIAAARELEIQSLRADCTLRKPITIWVVRQDDDLYVRSWRGPRSAWFRRMNKRHEGHIRAGGIDKDVTFVDTREKPLNAAIDVAHRAKYGDSRYLTPRYRASPVDHDQAPSPLSQEPQTRIAPQMFQLAPTNHQNGRSHDR